MPAKHTFRARLAAMPIIALSRVATLMPLTFNLWMGATIGWLIGHLLPFRKQVIMDNLRGAFPELSEREIKRIRQRFWVHLGLIAAENFAMGSARQRAMMQWEEEGENVFLREKIKENGIIAVTGHCGSFEMLLPFFGTFSEKSTGIAQPLHNGYLDDHINKNRVISGQDILPTSRGVSSEVKEKLKRGELVGFVSDADARRHGVFVNLFGRKTSTPRGPAKLALWTGCPIIPVFCVRTGLRRFKIIYAEPIWPPKEYKDKDLAVRDITQAYTDEIEKIVRRYPEQYFWIHRRWKTRPHHITDLHRKRAAIND